MSRAVAAAIFLGAAFAAAPAAAQSVASATTKLNLDKCRHVPGKAEEDYGEWRCQGYGGIPVHVAAGDQRIYVSFGRSAKKEPAAQQTLTSFNGEGDRIEWRGLRSADGKLKPFAAIMAWSTTVSGDAEPVRGRMLVVTRLGPGAVCHIGYVDAQANADAAALARKIADETAHTFKCGSDKPQILGKRGPGFSGPEEP
jgi:hypothetical protein